MLRSWDPAIWRNVAWCSKSEINNQETGLVQSPQVQVLCWCPRVFNIQGIYHRQLYVLLNHPVAPGGRLIFLTNANFFLPIYNPQAGKTDHVWPHTRNACSDWISNINWSLKHQSTRRYEPFCIHNGTDHRIVRKICKQKTPRDKTPSLKYIIISHIAGCLGERSALIQAGACPL